MILDTLNPHSWNLPLRVSSGDNARYGHWAQRHRKARAIRQAVRLTLGSWRILEGPLLVTLTRIAPRPLDTDGLASALKPVRDECAACLGMASDTGPRVAWRYRQERGAPKFYGVRIAFEWREPTCANCATRLAVDEPGTWDTERCVNPDCVYGPRPQARCQQRPISTPPRRPA